MKLCDKCKGNIIDKEELDDCRDMGVQPVKHPVTGEYTMPERLEIFTDVVFYRGDESQRYNLCAPCAQAVEMEIIEDEWMEQVLKDGGL